MSKYAEAADFGDTQENTARDAGDKLRFIERQFKWHGEDWHFRLLEKLTPNQVHGFFGKAKLIDKTLWFDGTNPCGKISYKMANDKFRNDLAALFGNIRVALAENKTIVKSFKTFFSEKEGYLTKDEGNFMFQLIYRSIAGQKIDSYAELAKFRESKNAAR